jgi:hypothetical protein
MFTLMLLEPSTPLELGAAASVGRATYWQVLFIVVIAHSMICFLLCEEIYYKWTRFGRE